MSKVKNPQEKKRLSYEKDRRNMYGEGRTHSVKSIRRRKTTANRTFRRGNKRVVQLISTESDTDNKEIRQLGKMKMKKKKWKKVPDKPLQHYVKKQKEKAEFRIGRKKAAKEKRKKENNG